MTSWYPKLASLLSLKVDNRLCEKREFMVQRPTYAALRFDLPLPRFHE